ncbi:MAG TPA: sigma-E factor regulatory protein RseB domain-containing protein [Candidatus Rubrimentiphilum sp.]|nr:sigma-E factor regulatory protein RseB domain-containing protein [Candidatus Rubrimentiphilum sp.]
MPLRKRLFSLFAALAVTLAATAASPRVDPAQLLREAVGAYGKLSYVGQIQNVDFGSSHTNAVLFRVEHRAPDLLRRWYLAPESLYGDSIISHGDMEYDVDVHQRRVVVARDDAVDDQVALDDNFDLLLRNYKAILGPNDTVAGRPAFEVLLVNKYTGETVIRLSLDSTTKLVLQRERFGSTGAVTNQMRFEQIRYTASIPSQVFDVPGGYRRVKGQNHGLPSNDLARVVRAAGFDARGPRLLPEGFLPVTGDVTDVQGVRTLHVMYSDGLRTISLFENARGAAVDMSHYTIHAAKVRNYDAQYVEDGSTTLLAWQQGSLHFALVGDLTVNELTRIGASV